MAQCVTEIGIELLGQLKRILNPTTKLKGVYCCFFGRISLQAVQCILCVSCELIIAGF